jgi:hypothetical protein
MDNCPSDLTIDMMDLLGSGRARVVTVAPHITQSFYLLDLTIFGIFKCERKYH